MDDTQCQGSGTNEAQAQKPVSCLARALDPPHYGWERNGELIVPARSEIFREFGRRMNVLADRKNWLPFFSWLAALSFTLPLVIFLTYYFSWWLLAAGFFYSMVILGSHGTFWLHRYSTHRAFQFRSPWVRELCRNMVLRVIPEEVYVISHHVHHQFPEKPGDPYNVNGGWLYCFLADANHQGIRKDLSEKEYSGLCKLINHTGVRANTYAQYLTWGSICHPLRTVFHYVLNWSFWYGAFYLLGGHPLAIALFGASGVWAIGVRTYNYEGHGKGKDRRRDGSDFNRRDLSVNQIWPGFVAGEWHNNHHLFPNGARSGFLNYQFDLPWVWIWTLHKLGAVTSFKDYRAQFMSDHYLPYLAAKQEAKPGVDGLVIGEPKPGSA